MKVFPFWIKDHSSNGSIADHRTVTATNTLGGITWFQLIELFSTVKLGDKERFDKEQIGVKELFTDYQPFYTINQLLDKKLWLI